MRAHRSTVLASLLLLSTGCGNGSAASTGPVQVPAHIDHAEWDRLLRVYVDERGLVDYGGWKASAADRGALSRYLERFTPEVRPAAEGKDEAAALINAYNALTIAWILANYPTRSIRSLDGSFDTARHRVGGRRVSLDDIEHKALRPRVGFRVHAALVCAARSCPPLARDAYLPERLDEQLDAALRRWLAREDLNRFSPAESKAEVSSIFKWFAEDFEKVGGVRGVLKTYGPPVARTLADDPRLKIEYLPYDWSLNDRAPRSGSYGRLRLLWDRLRDRLKT